MPTLKRGWTVADRDDLPNDRYEVIDGELLVTPSPSWDHQAALGHLHQILTEYVQRHRIGYWAVDLDARAVERSTPDEPRIEVLATELVWEPDTASEPLTIDLPAYFARVVDD